MQKRKQVLIFCAAAVLSACCIFYSESAPSAAAAQYSSYYNSAAYNQLLDELAQYPAGNTETVFKIINKILEFKGYPSNSIDIYIANINEAGTVSAGGHLLAEFDFFTGKINVSKHLIYNNSIYTIIAVLAHELDHFDKLACLCRSIGLNQFSSIFSDNGRYGLNTNFWQSVSAYADISSFDTALYKDALERSLNIKDLEHSSSYSDFYRLAENIRNPLEESAYKESDYVYNHFGIPVKDNDMKRLSRIFDKIDKGLHYTASSSPYLKNEIPALFDYFYAKAIIETMPEFKDVFYECVNYKNGNLTSFWLQFEGGFSDFYKTGRLEGQTKDSIFMLLNNTDIQIQKGISPEETAAALKYKMNTLKENLVYSGAHKHLRQTEADYFNYTKTAGIQN